MTRLRRSGSSPRLRAMSGIDTAIIVESSPSTKKAQPMTSGIRICGRGRGVGAEGALRVMSAARQPRLTAMGQGDHSRSQTRDGAAKVGEAEIGPEVLERWALDYLGRYASSAENLRRVLMRRA